MEEAQHQTLITILYTCQAFWKLRVLGTFFRTTMQDPKISPRASKIWPIDGDLLKASIKLPRQSYTRSPFLHWSASYEGRLEGLNQVEPPPLPTTILFRVARFTPLPRKHRHVPYEPCTKLTSAAHKPTSSPRILLRLYVQSLSRPYKKNLNKPLHTVVDLYASCRHLNS